MPGHNLSLHITEKSIALAKAGKFTFSVDPSLTAPEVANIVRSIYNVNPIKVAILKNAAKTKGSRHTLRKRPARVKAIVTLKRGEKIADFLMEEKKS